MPNLTENIIARTKPNAAKDVFLWDGGAGGISGLGVRIKPSGTRSFVVHYRNSFGKSKRITLGRCDGVRLSTARKLAREKLGQVAGGIDPAEVSKAALEAPTVEQFVERYFTDYAEVHKRPRSVIGDRSTYRRHVKRRLGSKKMSEVTRADVARLHSQMRDLPIAGNRTLAFLSKLFNLAEAWGVRPDYSNPCRHVKRYPENKCERFLAPAELARLAEVLDRVDRERRAPINATNIIRLLIFTGARRGEITGLKWGMVDIEAGELRLPESKTGPKTIHLNAPARELLAGLERGDDDALVFPNRDGGVMKALQIAWVRIRAEAGLSGDPDKPDLRLHDLRHSFATVGVGAGQSLVIIGKMLGHAKPITTARYAHADSDPVKAATEEIGKALAAMMGNRQASAEIIELPSRERK